MIDLTYVLSEDTPVYPGKTCFSHKICTHYENGYRLDDITLGTGIGTHMDAPSHFYPDGLTIDQIPLTSCYGALCVLHLAQNASDNIDYEISLEDVDRWEAENGKIPEESIVFADMGWGKHWGTEKFFIVDPDGTCHSPGFSLAAAERLIERKVKCVGVDAMSIELGNSTTYPVHVALLKRNIFLIENLANLDKLPSTGAQGWVLPMKIKDAPEAPVRAFAFI